MISFLQKFRANEACQTKVHYNNEGNLDGMIAYLYTANTWIPRLVQFQLVRSPVPGLVRFTNRTK